MRFKKIICLCILTVFLCGCSSSDEDYVYPEDVAQSQSEAIIEHVKNKDTEALKEMFCDRIKETHDLDTEIKTFLESIDGEIISHDEPKGYRGFKSASYGTVEIQELWGDINNIKTDTGKIYEIGFDSNYIYQEKPDCVGMCYIAIVDTSLKKEDSSYPDGAFIEIGGSTADEAWLSDVAQEQSKTIMECLVNKDAETIKGMFCEEIKNTHDLDKEIEELFNLIEGDIIDYEEPQGERGLTEKDGDKIIYQELEGHTNGIVTTTGGVYGIGFYGYYVNEYHPEYTGLGFIIMTDMSGDAEVALKRVGEPLD